MHISLKGKTALITGASRGIGYAIAETLGKAGANLILHYNRNISGIKQLTEQFPQQTVCLQADLSNPQAAIQLAKDAKLAFEGVDILVNNAGIALESLLAQSNEQWINDWERTMTVNLTATAILCQQLIPHFIQRGGGRMIHISSRAGFRGDTAEYMAYAASKGGMLALSKSIARAYGKQHIYSFAIAPGFTLTDMAQQFVDKYGKDYILNDIALPEITLPKDIAPTVLFLASGHMDHATGTTIDINAGSYVR